MKIILFICFDKIKVNCVQYIKLIFFDPKKHYNLDNNELNLCMSQHRMVLNNNQQNINPFNKFKI
jgi:hypothetical protein